MSNAKTAPRMERTGVARAPPRRYIRFGSQVGHWRAHRSHVSSTLPEIRYVLFSRIRLQASGTPDGIIGRCWAICPSMTCRHRHLDPEALAPVGWCRPAHRRSIGLIRESEGFRAISRARGFLARPLTFQGHILSAHLTFRTLTAEHSGIAAVIAPGVRCMLLGSSTSELAIRQTETPWHLPKSPSVGFSPLQMNVHYCYGPPGCPPPGPTGP